MPISLNHRASHHHPCRAASVDGACAFAAAIGSNDAADRGWRLGKLTKTITNFTSNPVGNPAGNLSYANAIASLTAGINTTCAITNQGAALCWGSNASGKLGDGTNTNRPSPTPVIGLASKQK